MSRRGFTLIEVAIALVAGGLVLTAGYAALGAIIDLRERAAAHAAPAERAAAVRRSLAHWLAGARVHPDDETVPAFLGLDRQRAGVPDDELRFLTTSAAPFYAGTAHVRLFIDRDDETPERGLVAEIAAWGSPAARRIEIAPAATGLDASYFFDTGRGRRWLPAWISSVQLPLAVELRIVAGPQSDLPVLLQLPILVPIGGAQ